MHAAYQFFEKVCLMIQLWNVHGRFINLQGRLPTACGRVVACGFGRNSYHSMKLPL